jgi:hypothetical protein
LPIDVPFSVVPLEVELFPSCWRTDAEDEDDRAPAAPMAPAPPAEPVAIFRKSRLFIHSKVRMGIA